MKFQRREYKIHDEVKETCNLGGKVNLRIKYSSVRSDRRSPFFLDSLNNMCSLSQSKVPFSVGYSNQVFI